MFDGLERNGGIESAQCRQMLRIRHTICHSGMAVVLPRIGDGLTIAIDGDDAMAAACEKMRAITNAARHVENARAGREMACSPLIAGNMIAPNAIDTRRDLTFT